ncbi:MAG: SdpI family protein [Kangiellaceae bacterium]|nr:SdpI family protein [Kangiellaceae bacterium]
MRELIAILMIATGVLYIVLAIPLKNKKVGPNGLYGLRTKATFSNPDVWYEANRISAGYMSKVGWLIMLTSIVTYFISALSFEWMLAIDLAVVILGTVWMAWASIGLANKLARQVSS